MVRGVLVILLALALVISGIGCASTNPDGTPTTAGSTIGGGVLGAMLGAGVGALIGRRPPGMSPGGRLSARSPGPRPGPWVASPMPNTKRKCCGTARLQKLCINTRRNRANG